MSVRVGHIMRNEDVHGVSGIGKVADVFEATNGKCIVVWISAHSSTNVYDNVKHVESTHSHGGKSMVVWDWESEPDPDPMNALKEGAAEKTTLTDGELAEIAALAAEEAKVKVAEKIAQKMAESAATKEAETEVGPVEEEPKGSKKNGTGKKAPAKKAPAKKEKP
jgi:hypothetical protein